MRIRDYAGSIRELHQHLSDTRLREAKQDHKQARIQEARSDAADAVNVDPALRRDIAERRDPADAARRERIANAVRDGTYQPEIRDVAKAFIREVLV